MNELNWTDTLDIAISLVDKYPDINPLTIRFTDLHAYICDLENFVGVEGRSNEKILEAIQMAWIDEK